jgi:hypothetical protein
MHAPCVAQEVLSFQSKAERLLADLNQLLMQLTVGVVLAHELMTGCTRPSCRVQSAGYA